MSKTEVYSWRVDPDLKQALEATAREQGSSVSAVIEQACRELIARTGSEESDEQRQARLRKALLAVAGTAKGPGTSATNERVREAFRSKRREAGIRRHAAKSG
ncbi:MAG: ribbon-helix-helix protein, CopG family [Pseudomonadota bacterium]